MCAPAVIFVPFVQDQCIFKLLCQQNPNINKLLILMGKQFAGYFSIFIPNVLHDTSSCIDRCQNQLVIINGSLNILFMEEKFDLKTSPT